ncbi:MAG: hypothetical protein ABW212_11240, partial [Pseudonocardia sediminis]
DETFLLLAGHDGLASLGFGYANIVATRVDDPSPVLGDTDVLVLRWGPAYPMADGAVRQRVCLSVLGPTARSSALRTWEVLSVAGDALLSRHAADPAGTSIEVSAPHLQQGLVGRLVTTGFDVLTHS